MQKTNEALKGFDSYMIKHIRRNQNKKADELIKLVSMTFEHLTKEVLIEFLVKRSIEEKEILQVETKEEETPPQTNDVVKEIHEGTCGFNTEPRSMMVRITKQGYYWKSMHRDAAKVIQECKNYKEQSAIRKVAKNGAIAAENGWSLTYGSEAIIPIAENTLAKDDKRRTKEATKKKEGKEVASIKEAYYQNKLRRYHNDRSSHSTYKIGDFVLLSQNDKGNPQVWQGPHMISELHEWELYKIIDAYDHSLI
ncbi:hypothetical protein Tco_0822209 [Tanacetum coccineum]|uniref:Reverse transcriptase domain-containing protein n=1 Tax=Tanacetum coccineum TaxID=301880 RepID=A0ABQ5AEF4_9ASTR